MKTRQEQWSEFASNVNKWHSVIHAALIAISAQADQAGEDEEFNLAWFGISLHQIAKNEKGVFLSVGDSAFDRKIHESEDRPEDECAEQNDMELLFDPEDL